MAEGAVVALGAPPGFGYADAGSSLHMQVCMETLTLFGTRFITGDRPLPKPDNTNWLLMEPWMTPAELLQWVRQTREEMRREIAADPGLLTCPKHRRSWVSLEALEHCALWRYYGVREG
jgi:hypothetical protein